MSQSWIRHRNIRFPEDLMRFAALFCCSKLRHCIRHCKNNVKNAVADIAKLVHNEIKELMIINMALSKAVKEPRFFSYKIHAVSQPRHAHANTFAYMRLSLTDTWLWLSDDLRMFMLSSTKSPRWIFNGPLTLAYCIIQSNDLLLWTCIMFTTAGYIPSEVVKNNLKISPHRYTYDAQNEVFNTTAIHTCFDTSYCQLMGS